VTKSTSSPLPITVAAVVGELLERRRCARTERRIRRTDVWERGRDRPSTGGESRIEKGKEDVRKRERRRGCSVRDGENENRRERTTKGSI
jgi:hypothetical protein